MSDGAGPFSVADDISHSVAAAFPDGSLPDPAAVGLFDLAPESG